MYRFLLLLAVLLVLPSVARPASAQATLGVIGVGADGIPRSEAERVGRDLVAAASTVPGVTVIPHLDKTLGDTLVLLGCSDAGPRCLDELADSLGVDRLLAASILQVGGQPTLQVQYWDAARDSLEFTVSFGADAWRAPERLRTELIAYLGGSFLLTVRGDRLDSVRVDGQPPVGVLTLPVGSHVVSWREVTGRLREERVRFDFRSRYTLWIGDETLQGTRLERADVPVPVWTAAPLPVEVAEVPGSEMHPSWWVTGAGVAVTGVGLYFGYLTFDAAERLDRSVYQREAHDIADEGRTWAMLTNIALATGGALVIGGVSWWWFGEDEGGESEASSETRTLGVVRF